MDIHSMRNGLMGNIFRRASLFILGSIFVFVFDLLASVLVYFHMSPAGFWCAFCFFRILSLIFIYVLTLRNTLDHLFVAGAKLLLLCILMLLFFWITGKTHLSATLFGRVWETASPETDNFNGLLLLLHWILYLFTAVLLLLVGIIIGAIQAGERLIRKKQGS